MNFNKSFLFASVKENGERKGMVISMSSMCFVKLQNLPAAPSYSLSERKTAALRKSEQRQHLRMPDYPEDEENEEELERYALALTSLGSSEARGKFLGLLERLKDEGRDALAIKMAGFVPENETCLYYR